MLKARKHKLKKKFPKELWHPLVCALQFDGTQECANEISKMIGAPCIINCGGKSPKFLIDTWWKDRKNNKTHSETYVEVGTWVIIDVEKEASPELWFDDLFQLAYRK
jgi:hypothetical protein